MGLCRIVLNQPIEMSQKLLNHSLQLIVVFAIFLADVGSSSFNISRHTTGDVFQNANSSKSCNESGPSCVFDGKKSPFCGINCCSCICPNRMPTYLLRNRNCTSEDQLMSILKIQSSKQGCDHRMVVAESHLQCQKEVLSTLNTLNPGNKTLYLCPWNKGFARALLHFRLVKDLHTCEIVPEESLYLNRSWQHRLHHNQALSKLNVKIEEDPAVASDRLSLEWFADIGKKYDGLIFSLKLKCRGKGGNELNSCVHFKKGGFFTDVKPTSQAPISSKRNHTQNITIGYRTERTTTTALLETEQSTLPNMLLTTFSANSGVVVLSSSNQPKVNLIVVVLAALSGVLFGFLALLAVFLLLWRRRRQFEVGKEANNASNPFYARGASDTLKMENIEKANGQSVEECLDYQPLVENTKPTERKDSLPGYLTLSADPRFNQRQPSNRGIRSSNYLSLFKDCPEDAREYQTLMKDTEPVKLEIANEDKIPDYAEIEERTDSEDSSYSSDSEDYEEPPVIDPNKRKKLLQSGKRRLNNLSSGGYDYDEPEGIIVISDSEGDPKEKGITDNKDFHDYADPDETDENNVNCCVTRTEDLPCYHDYDDPE